jgi:hypothetical protein
MRQKICYNIGRWGCYLESLCLLAQEYSGKSVDIVEFYKKALEARWIQEDCLVLRPEEILRDITGKEWTFRKVPKSEYIFSTKDWRIACYERRTTGETVVHFVYLKKSDGSIDDPYGRSETVANGQLVSYRIFQVKE